MLSAQASVWKFRTIRQMIVFGCLCFGTLTHKALQAINCRFIPDLHKSYLLLNSDMICYSGSHLSVVIIAYIILVVFSIGFPVSISIWLVKNSSKLDEASVWPFFGTLYETFQNSSYLSGPITIFVLLFLTIFGDLLVDIKHAQFATLLLTLIIFLILMIWKKPSSKAMENVVIYIVIATCLLGVLINYLVYLDVPSAAIIALCVIHIVMIAFSFISTVVSLLNASKESPKQYDTQSKAVVIFENQPNRERKKSVFEMTMNVAASSGTPLKNEGIIEEGKDQTSITKTQTLINPDTGEKFLLSTSKKGTEEKVESLTPVKSDSISPLKPTTPLRSSQNLLRSSQNENDSLRSSRSKLFPNPSASSKVSPSRSPSNNPPTPQVVPDLFGHNSEGESISAESNDEEKPQILPSTPFRTPQTRKSHTVSSSSKFSDISDIGESEEYISDDNDRTEAILAKKLQRLEKRQNEIHGILANSQKKKMSRSQQIKTPTSLSPLKNIPRSRLAATTIQKPNQQFHDNDVELVPHITGTKMDDGLARSSISSMESLSKKKEKPQLQQQQQQQRSQQRSVKSPNKVAKGSGFQFAMKRNDNIDQSPKKKAELHSRETSPEKVVKPNELSEKDDEGEQSQIQQQQEQQQKQEAIPHEEINKQQQQHLNTIPSFVGVYPFETSSLVSDALSDTDSERD
eukprot:TRINITY_DN211_c0_g1_i3.p1 TRINITY_DN211_c0_g1~~TRINITY_DN211_c0_g1_i3.p1  ORF type:complete len:739 (-),score=264.59 TRINITY_DN211_c0_g1_i3:669-2726(-)